MGTSYGNVGKPDKSIQNSHYRTPALYRIKPCLYNTVALPLFGVEERNHISSMALFVLLGSFATCFMHVDAERVFFGRPCTRFHLNGYCCLGVSSKQ